MNPVLFIHKDSPIKGETLKKVIDQKFKKIETHTLQTFNSLKERLKQVSNYNKEIFILLADSKRRLNKLTPPIDLIERKRIILILPDGSKATVSIAHQFFPRYFTYINDTYAGLCAVITKMTSKKTKRS